MARKPRLHVPEGTYHVMLRGNGGQPLFFGDEDHYRFYLLLQESAIRFDYRIQGFCLLDNHLHLALQVAKTPLAKGMQNLAFRYTRWINRRESRTGHLFRGRYQTILVERDRYLLALVRYIHLNPVPAGLVQQPESYPWSGHRADSDSDGLPWLTAGWVLGQFGRETQTARRRFRRFVHDGIGLGHEPRFHVGSVPDGRVLGEDRFVERMLSRDYPEPVTAPTVDAIVAAITSKYGLSETELSVRGNTPTASQARASVGWVAVHSDARWVGLLENQRTPAVARPFQALSGSKRHRVGLTSLNWTGK